MRIKALLAVAVAALALASTAVAATGGSYTVPSGASVQILASDAYPADDARNQAWADFLDGLLHGGELASVTLYLAPPAEVRRVCGEQALACYAPGRRLIVASPEDVPGGPSAQAVVIHEYGHHVASSRSNVPWSAGNWGPKRWATAADVCSRAQGGSAFPGDEGDRYRLNPGEAFAEVYRLLNERRAGKPETPWGIVDGSFYPDEAAVAAAEADVTSPWLENTSAVFRSTLRPGKGRYRFTVATPYDGTVKLTLRAPTSGAFELRLFEQGRLVAKTRSSIALTACGQRSFLASVVRLRGAGAFSVAVSRP